MLGQIFDTLLGVLLMFAVLGIVNAVLVEAVPRILQILPGSRTRGELLKLAIENMFGGAGKGTSSTVARLCTDLYAHPLIRALGSSAKQLPSYIAPATFATVLIDILYDRSDKQGNAIAKMLLAEAAIGTERLTAALSGLPLSTDMSAPRPLAQLSARLNSDIKASTRNDGSIDAINLTSLSFCWPSALDLVKNTMSSTSDEDKLDTLRKTLVLIPASWHEDLQPLFSELERASNPDKYVKAIQWWESTSCEVPRSAMNTLDQIKCLVDSLPDDVKNLRCGLQAVYARMNPVVNAATADVETFYRGVENWFGEVTDRVAGWYKRNARIWGVICAFILCIIANADVIYVVRALSSDAALRARVAQAAIKTVTDYEASVKAKTPSEAAQGKKNTKPPAPISNASVSAASGATGQAGKPNKHPANVVSAASATASSSTDVAASAAASAAAVVNAAPLPILGSRISPECSELNAKTSRNEGWTAAEVTALIKCEQETAAAGFTYLENSALPIGWSVARQNLVFAGYYANAGTARSWGERMLGALSSGAFWLWLSGVVISSLAVTLGGEYWFNLLEEVVRLSGPPPTTPDKKA